MALLKWRISVFRNYQRMILGVWADGQSTTFSPRITSHDVLPGGGLAVVYYIYIGVAFVFGLAAAFLFDYLAKYTSLSVYEVSNDMVPIDRELLEEIIREWELQSEPDLRRNARDRRRRLRLDLDMVRVRVRRILTNAVRPKYWVLTDRRVMRKNRVEHPPEVARGIKEVLAIQHEVWRLSSWLLFRIWLWNVSGFERREWGPIPKVQHFNITKVIGAYDRLKMATVNLARCYGEAAIAEEIASVM